MTNIEGVGLKCGFLADYKSAIGRVWRVLAVCSVAVLLAACGVTGTKKEAAFPVPEVSKALRQEVVMTALGLMGSPYRYGGSHPSTGFDCSGLVNYVFQTAAGARLPRTTGAQAASSRRISRRDLREGDLVFFNTLGRAHSHVGIYVGDGRFVNAPSSGGQVRIDRLDNPYFARRFDSARTLFASR